MAEDAQNRIQSAISQFVEEIDRTRLRQLQYDMHSCSAECCRDLEAPMDQVMQCVERCSRDLSRGQNYVQNELTQFQERLQRGVLMCQDRVRESMSGNPTDSELRRHKADFEACAVACVDHHIGQLPSLMEKVKKNLNQ